VLSLVSEHPEAKVLASLEYSSYRYQIVVTVLAMIGLGQGILINEKCARSYIPTEAEISYYNAMMNQRLQYLICFVGKLTALLEYQ
jgi:hypothetical protein